VKAIFFQTLAAFRKWLEQHYAKVDAVWVGFYKKGSGKPSITWSESVDEALCCFGHFSTVYSTVGKIFAAKLRNSA
jgi:uncharacterized protein YdeI (YjbR/CyaY-like superfamily)